MMSFLPGLAHLRCGDKSLCRALLCDPNAAAVGIDVDRCGRAPDAALGDLGPAFDGPVGILAEIGGCHCLGQGFVSNECERNGTGSARANAASGVDGAYQSSLWSCPQKVR